MPPLAISIGFTSSDDDFGDGDDYDDVNNGDENEDDVMVMMIL